MDKNRVLANTGYNVRTLLGLLIAKNVEYFVATQAAIDNSLNNQVAYIEHALWRVPVYVQNGAILQRGSR